MEYSDLLGIPFKFGGRDRDGMDCWGIVQEVHKRLGNDVHDPMCGEWKEVKDDLRIGDVLVFGYSGCGAVTHCSVWLGGGKMLHAMERLGVIVSPFRHMQKRYIKAYRYAATNNSR